MSQILNWTQIKKVLPQIDLIAAMEAAFLAYSEGKSVIPPVGELSFDNPPGDVHIKYGCFKGGEAYVVKIASGFHQNEALGIPNSQGLMLLFCQRTGQLEAILLDEGKLTDARTGAAGALAAKLFSRKHIQQIGIVGTGIQAREQAKHLRAVVDCDTLLIWGRDPSKALTAAADAGKYGYKTGIRPSLEDLVRHSDLIITTTPSTTPLIQAEWVKAGACIVAVGSDTAEKQELDPQLLAKADIVVADSRSQCAHRGEIFQATKAGLIDPSRVVELGQVIGDTALGRVFEDQIVVIDLTGVAVQDLAIATAVTSTINRLGM